MADVVKKRFSIYSLSLGKIIKLRTLVSRFHYGPMYFGLIQYLQWHVFFYTAIFAAF